MVASPMLENTKVIIFQSVSGPRKCPGLEESRNKEAFNFSNATMETLTGIWTTFSDLACFIIFFSTRVLFLNLFHI